MWLEGDFPRLSEVSAPPDLSLSLTLFLLCPPTPFSSHLLVHTSISLTVKSKHCLKMEKEVTLLDQIFLSFTEMKPVK